MKLGNEVLTLKARIADLKEQLKDKNLQADSNIRALRELISPYTDDFTKLALRQASATLKSLIKLQDEAKELREKISKLEDELNG